MAWKKGQSGNLKGRPPIAPDMRDAMALTAARIQEMMPGAHLTAHMLLSAIYKDDAMPIGCAPRRSASACAPRRPALACALLT
jgi:hypothetical protein